MSAGLRPGVTVFEVPGRGTAVRGADGTMSGLALPDDHIAELRTWFAAPQQPPPADLADELEVFAAAGHLGPRPTWPAGRRRVGVLATDPDLAELLRDGLEAAGAQPQAVSAVVPDLHALRTDALCAVHHGPAPAWWADLDAVVEAGVAWQRTSIEGRHAILEPVADSPNGVRHVDVRARRLAAAGSGHAHLRAYWDSDPVCALDVTDRALLVSLVVADLRAWALGHTGATGNLVPAVCPPAFRLRVLDLDSATIADHPVLPVPASAP